jgi:hypothetical protein
MPAFTIMMGYLIIVPNGTHAQQYSQQGGYRVQDSGLVIKNNTEESNPKPGDDVMSLNKSLSGKTLFSSNNYNLF